MTAPDRTTWTVAEDGWGDPTIWTDGDHAVASRWGDRISVDPAYTEQVWQVLTRVLAPDEATIERLAALFFSWESPTDWSTVGPVMGNIFRQRAHEALAALAGTAAPQAEPEVGES